MEYVPFMLNLNSSKKEKVILLIDSNKESTFAPENIFKQDSIKKLISEGKLSPDFRHDKKYPKTNFSHIVNKNYGNQNVTDASILIRQAYLYEQRNEIKWQLFSDTLILKEYVCNKATTRYEGRDYTAWYTSEIPISDGPYKFWGLPGLILKIFDSENHYSFTLESFEKQKSEPNYLASITEKALKISYEKFKELSKEASEDPIKVFENQRNVKIVHSSSPVVHRPNFIGRF
jgi:GLPGLI family protein